MTLPSEFPAQLMIQGTTSDAGKSTLVCALGRIFARHGIHVAPFKPQNMALNSAVTADGGEIGRAQALQALACGVEASTDMNPVLLKPTTDMGSQVIIQGRAIGHQSALNYHDYKQTAMQAVLQSYRRLQTEYDCVLTEGAGSPAEVNLRANDIANMGFAEAVDCPVILIADIDRGGVFAHLVGTLDCLSESERNRIVGFVINRFRGDLSLLQDGLDWLEQKTGKPVLAVLPYLHGLYLDGEDALTLTQQLGEQHADQQPLKVVVPVYPRISNHTDLDALRVHPGVELTLVGPGQQPPAADLVILPGSKNTRADLQWLLAQDCQWQDYLNKHLRYGGKLIGICGGLQMLGKTIADPDGIEGQAGDSDGLGYLPIRSELKATKTLKKNSGILQFPGQPAVAVQGYEIHAGISELPADKGQTIQHIIKNPQNNCGFLTQDQQVFASYWHGLFDTAEALQQILFWAGLKHSEAPDFTAIREQQLNRLADSTEHHFDFRKLQSALDKFNK